MKYAFIEAHAASFRLNPLCQVLEVSRSGYYDWKRRGSALSPRKQKQQLVDTRVAEFFEANKRRSGSPRLTHELKEEGIHVNRKTVASSMQRQQPRAKAAAKFKATTNSASFIVSATLPQAALANLRAFDRILAGTAG